jgi:hypothetical protein
VCLLHQCNRDHYLLHCKMFIMNTLKIWYKITQAIWARFFSEKIIRNHEKFLLNFFWDYWSLSHNNFWFFWTRSTRFIRSPQIIEEVKIKILRNIMPFFLLPYWGLSSGPTPWAFYLSHISLHQPFFCEVFFLFFFFFFLR